MRWLIDEEVSKNFQEIKTEFLKLKDRIPRNFSESQLTLIPVCLMRWRFRFSLVDSDFPHSGHKKLFS
jgi:hypothetical protein